MIPQVEAGDREGKERDRRDRGEEEESQVGRGRRRVGGVGEGGRGFICFSGPAGGWLRHALVVMVTFWALPRGDRRRVAAPDDQGSRYPTGSPMQAKHSKALRVVVTILLLLFPPHFALDSIK